MHGRRGIEESGHQDQPASRDASLSPSGPYRRFMLWALLGAVLALLIDVWMLAAGHPSLLQREGTLGSLFDIQGRALLAGHLAIPHASAGIEGFEINGSTYLYYGPFPALLRLPVLGVTHSLDGRMTQASMILAFLLLSVAIARLHWRVRLLLRPAAALRRSELVACMLFSLAVGAGAVPLYLASWAAVYHEVELWGAALSLGALQAILGVLLRPSRRGIAWAGLLSVLAINTRVSVALAPVAALTVIAAAVAARRGRHRLGRWRLAKLADGVSALSHLPHPSAIGRGMLAALIAATLAPLVTSAAVNEAKFGMPFGIPITRQVDSQIDANRRLVLAANHNSLFGLKFVPTTLFQAARPDAVGSVRAFPFVSFPRRAPTVVANARFDTLDPSLSILTSMPLFALLTGLGLMAIWRWPPSRVLAGMLAGSAAGFVTALTIAFVTTRYLADFLPFLALGGLIGLQATLEVTSGRRRWPLLVTMGLLLIAGFATNAGAGLIYQRLGRPQTPMADRASFVRLQDDIDRFLNRRPHGIASGRVLPASGPPGGLFVLGRCDGLYVAAPNGTWLPVERTDRSGARSLKVIFGASSGSEALLTLGAGARRVTLAATPRGPRMLLLSVRVGGRTAATATTDITVSIRPATVRISFDRLFGRDVATVSIDGRPLLTSLVPYDRLARAIAGSDPQDATLRRFSGSVLPLSSGAPLCASLTRRARLEL